MGHLSYEDSKKAVFRGLILLAIVTLVEVGFSLFGKGYIISGVEKYRWVIYGAALIILVLSIYKAYFIIYEFMHMRYEVPGLVRSVLLPTALLIWAIIAFFWEGNAWKNNRLKIEKKNMESVESSPEVGMDVRQLESKDFE